MLRCYLPARRVPKFNRLPEEYNMAFFDWNGDGKKDLCDDLIEHTYSNKKNRENRNNGSDDDLKGFFYIAMLPLALFMLLCVFWRVIEDLCSLFSYL